MEVACWGGCSFQEKTEHVQLVGARGLVIVNTNDALLTAAAPGFTAGRYCSNKHTHTRIQVAMIQAKDEAALLAATCSVSSLGL